MAQKLVDYLKVSRGVLQMLASAIHVARTDGVHGFFHLIVEPGLRFYDVAAKTETTLSFHLLGYGVQACF